jgi:hypothetical protein
LFPVYDYEFESTVATPLPVVTVVLVLLYEFTAAAGLPLTKLEIAEAPPRLVVGDVKELIDVTA